MRFINLIFLLLGTAYVANAQAPLADSLATKHLDEVVITGQFEPQSAQKSVYKVRTIAMEKIQARGAVRLQDVLNTELNIRFDQDLALGGSNLSMQGLAGQNVKVLIDGVPMIGRQGTTNEVNINQINVNSIERIEIVEGPMSVVYGADALAGVINIITKKSNEGKLDLTVRVHEETIGKEYAWDRGIHNESVSGGYSWDQFFARGDVSRNFSGGWKGNATGRERQWHPKEQWLASGTAGYNAGRINVYYRHDFLNETINNPGEFGASSGNPNEAIDQDYVTNRFMHQLQGSYKDEAGWDVTTALAYTDYNRETISSTVNKTTGDRRLALGAGLQDVTRFNGLTARSTAQLKLSESFSLQPGFDINRENGEGGRITEGVQSIGDYAVFVSGEWKVTPWLQVRPGLRAIYNTVYQAPPVIPSVNAKVAIARTHDLRVSYGRGFRAPSLRELYFDFFDASHSIEGNTNLEAELSHSLNGSWNWKAVEKHALALTLTAGGFYNTVDNMISYGQKPGNSLITTYINIDRYKTQGLTVGGKLQKGALEGNVGFAYTGRYNQLNESDHATAEFVWSPEVTSSLSYAWKKAGLILTAYHKYTGVTPFYELVTVNGEQVANLAEISGFHWADASLKKNIGDHFAITAGSRNLFNVTNVNNTSLLVSGAHTNGGNRPVGTGRSYYVSLTYSLFKF